MSYSILKSTAAIFLAAFSLMSSVVFAGDIILALEEPTANSTYTGIANVRGWTTGSAGINRVELYVNGEFKTNIPVGGQRTDVGNQYPNYPNSSNSGYSMAFNYSSLNAGQHKILVRAVDNNGDYKDSLVNFNVTRLDNPFISDPLKISLIGATLSKDNQSIFIKNIMADGKAYDFRLDWRTAIQNYAIAQIAPASGGGSQCGNGICETGETASSCPNDCYSPPKCGNGICETGETASSCPNDCYSPPAKTVITLGINNQCPAGTNVKWRYFDFTNSLASQVYQTSSQGLYSSNLECTPGARICYGARTEFISYGVDIDASKSCSDCCVICQSGVEQFWTVDCILIN